MPINILLFWIMICGNNYFDKKWHVCCIHKTRDTQHFTNVVEVIIELHLRGFVIHGLESWYEQCRHDATYAAGNLARNDSPISRSRVPHCFWLCDEALAHTKIVYVVSIDYNIQDKLNMTNIHEQNSSNTMPPSPLSIFCPCGLAPAAACAAGENLLKRGSRTGQDGKEEKPGERKRKQRERDCSASLFRRVGWW